MKRIGRIHTDDFLTLIRADPYYWSNPWPISTRLAPDCISLGDWRPSFYVLSASGAAPGCLTCAVISGTPGVWSEFIYLSDDFFKMTMITILLVEDNER